MSEIHPDDILLKSEFKNDTDFNLILKNLKNEYPDNRESDFFKLIYNSLHNSVSEIYWIDKEEKIIFANNKACLKLGYKIEDILGKTFDEIRDDTDNIFSYDALWDCLKKDHGFVHYELKHRKSNNTTYDVESHANFFSLKNIEFICIFSHDISQRKKYQNILKKSKSEMNALMNSVHEDVIYYNTKHKIQWVNDKPVNSDREFFDDIRGRRCYLSERNGEKECEECTVEKVLKTGQCIVEEKCKSSGRWLEISGHPVYDSTGNITGAVESVLDITKSKQIENALHERENQYKKLFTTMTNAFSLQEIVTDEAGNAVDYRFLEVNPAFEKMAEVRAEDIIGKTFLDVFPMIKPEIIKKYTSVALKGEPASFSEYNPLVKKHLNIYAYSPHKGQFATIFTDITDVVRLKSEQKMSLEQINKNYEQLAILNDEIRNPLQAIMGYILLEDFKYSDMIKDQIGVIDKLVNRLDQRWLESDKIRDFLRKHYDFD